ncbi:MAG TPA: PhoH family protein, partial [Acidimicrobiales bacterium]|nr:PhoH family protein [Acidimicrobiales bacterium]
MSTTEVKILVPDNRLMASLVGQHDENLRLVEGAFPGTSILVRGNQITIGGKESEKVGRLFDEIVLLLKQGHGVDPTNIGRTIDMVKSDESPSEVLGTQVLRSSAGKTVRPKTAGQKRYVEAISSNVVTFGIGPAGTGKSYLAVALGLQFLQAKT